MPCGTKTINTLPVSLKKKKERTQDSAMMAAAITIDIDDTDQQNRQQQQHILADPLLQAQQPIFPNTTKANMLPSSAGSGSIFNYNKETSLQSINSQSRLKQTLVQTIMNVNRLQQKQHNNQLQSTGESDIQNQHQRYQTSQSPSTSQHNNPRFLRSNTAVMASMPIGGANSAVGGTSQGSSRSQSQQQQHYQQNNLAQQLALNSSQTSLAPKLGRLKSHKHQLDSATLKQHNHNQPQASGTTHSSQECILALPSVIGVDSHNQNHAKATVGATTALSARQTIHANNAQLESASNQTQQLSSLRNRLQKLDDQNSTRRQQQITASQTLPYKYNTSRSSAAAAKHHQHRQLLKKDKTVLAPIRSLNASPANSDQCIGEQQEYNDAQQDLMRRVKQSRTSCQQQKLMQKPKDCKNDDELQQQRYTQVPQPGKSLDIEKQQTKLQNPGNTNTMKRKSFVNDKKIAQKININSQNNNNNEIQQPLKKILTQALNFMEKAPDNVEEEEQQKGEKQSRNFNKIGDINSRKIGTRSLEEDSGKEEIQYQGDDELGIVRKSSFEESLKVVQNSSQQIILFEPDTTKNTAPIKLPDQIIRMPSIQHPTTKHGSTKTSVEPAGTFYESTNNTVQAIMSGKNSATNDGSGQGLRKANQYNSHTNILNNKKSQTVMTKSLTTRGSFVNQQSKQSLGGGHKQPIKQNLVVEKILAQEKYTQIAVKSLAAIGEVKKSSNLNINSTIMSGRISKVSANENNNPSSAVSLKEGKSTNFGVVDAVKDANNSHTINIVSQHTPSALVMPLLSTSDLKKNQTSWKTPINKPEQLSSSNKLFNKESNSTTNISKTQKLAQIAKHQKKKIQKLQAQQQQNQEVHGSQYSFFSMGGAATNNLHQKGQTTTLLSMAQASDLALRLPKTSTSIAMISQQSNKVKTGVGSTTTSANQLQGSPSETHLSKQQIVHPLIVTPSLKKTSTATALSNNPNQQKNQQSSLITTFDQQTQIYQLQTNQNGKKNQKSAVSMHSKTQMKSSQQALRNLNQQLPVQSEQRGRNSTVSSMIKTNVLQQQAQNFVRGPQLQATSSAQKFAQISNGPSSKSHRNLFRSSESQQQSQQQPQVTTKINQQQSAATYDNKSGQGSTTFKSSNSIKRKQLVSQHNRATAASNSQAAIKPKFGSFGEQSAILHTIKSTTDHRQQEENGAGPALNTAINDDSLNNFLEHNTKQFQFAQTESQDSEVSIANSPPRTITTMTDGRIFANNTPLLTGVEADKQKQPSRTQRRLQEQPLAPNIIKTFINSLQQQHEQGTKTIDKVTKKKIKTSKMQSQQMTKTKRDSGGGTVTTKTTALPLIDFNSLISIQGCQHHEAGKKSIDTNGDSSQNNNIMINLLSEPKLEEESSQEMMHMLPFEVQTDQSQEEQPCFSFVRQSSPKPEILQQQLQQDDLIMITEKNLQEIEDHEEEKDRQIAEFKNDSFVIQHDKFMTPDKLEEKGAGTIYATMAFQIDQATNTDEMQTQTETQTVVQNNQNHDDSQSDGVEKVQHNVSLCEQEDNFRNVQNKLFLYQFNQMYGESETKIDQNSEQSATSNRGLVKRPSSCSDIGFTLEMLNKMQVPKNHQGLISQLPIHLMHGEAELYKEIRYGGSKTTFQPINEFISLKLEDDEQKLDQDRRLSKGGKAVAFSDQDAEENDYDEMLDQLYVKFNLSQQGINNKLVLEPGYKYIGLDSKAKPAIFREHKIELLADQMLASVPELESFNF